MSGSAEGAALQTISVSQPGRGEAWITTSGDFSGVKLREYWGYHQERLCRIPNLAPHHSNQATFSSDQLGINMDVVIAPVQSTLLEAVERTGSERRERDETTNR